MTYDTPRKDLDVFTGKNVPKPLVDLNDFAWTEENEPHPSRRTKLLKKYGRKITSLMGYEWKTKYIVLALMALQIGLARVLADQAPLVGEHGGKFGTITFWLVVYVVGATATQALFLAEHEISHNLAFKRFLPNKVFGVFANLPMVLPFFISFKEYHNEHHKWQGDAEMDTDLPTEFEARMMSSFLGKLCFLFNQTWHYAFRPLFVKPKPFTAWHALNFSVQIVFLAAITHFWGFGSVLYLFFSAHWAGSLHPMASHFIAEHYTFVEGAETVSYYGPLNKLAFNVGYHDIHHDFPKIPWSRLPMVYDLVDEYKSLPYHTSWTKVMINFLMNDQYTLYNRTKRHTKKSN